MKKQLTAVLLLTALLMTMAGCSAANAAHRLDAAEDRVEEKLDTMEDSVERAVRKAISAPTESGTDTTITQDQAENIALKYAGFTAGQVTHLRTEYEIDDGIPQYDVSFLAGDWEYEFEIDAKTGTILSYDKDHRYD